MTTELVRMIVGRELEAPKPKTDVAVREGVLEVRNLSKRGMPFRDNHTMLIASG